MTHTEPLPALSVVAPCFDEQDALPAFAQRASAACRAAVGESYEIVLVNDGSRDRTWDIMKSLAATDPHIVGVNLARNHGHQLAVSAGLRLARGARVMIIDADLQDPPELVTEMMTLMDEGHDVVYGRRRERANESAFKKGTASLFYRALRALSNVDIPVDTGDFRLMSRRIVDRLNAMPEQDRFIRGMVAWLGGSQVALVYDRHARIAGSTKYTLRKMVRLAIDGLIGFSTAPLRLATLLALFGAAGAIAIAIYILASVMFGNVVPGWASLAFIVTFFSSAQLLCVGIVGEYVGRTYMQAKNRPLFMIDEIVNKTGAKVVAD
jgi:glycosyltransferase involved in cell wall biosynthesis